MSLRRWIWLALVLLASGVPARAQDDAIDFGGKTKSEKVTDYVKMTTSVEPAAIKRGQSGVLKITLKIADGWHTYPTAQPAGAVSAASVNVYSFDNTLDVVWVGKLKEPPAKVLTLEGGDKQAEYEHELTVEHTFVVRPDALPGATTLRANARILLCIRKGKLERCLIPEDIPIAVPFTILADKVPVDKQYTKEVDAAIAGSPPEENPKAANGASPPVKAEAEPAKMTIRAEMPATTQDLAKSYESLIPNLLQTPVAGDTGLWAFILAGIFWGAVSLVTPCVFPMIPITVTFFLKQAEKEHHKPLTLALVYCGTIVVVLTIAAMILLSAFRAASINPLTNILIGILFIFFACSLFGLFEIELSSRWQLGFFLLFFSGLFGIIAYESRTSGLPSPWWEITLGLIGLFNVAALAFLIFKPGELNLASYTASRQEQGGIVGTIFMALTFTIISFACVAPFLGAFGSASSEGLGFWHRLLGGLAFSGTFAAPFFLLAVFPSVLKKLPKSGAWMNTVKVVMGFVELAAALKFLRQGELRLVPIPEYFTFDLVLGLWIALCILAGLYLLNLYRLPHDTPAEHLSVPRLILASCFLGVGLYLLPALFRIDVKGEKQDPGGKVYDWLNAFLLPDPSTSNENLPWSGNLQLALQRAREQHKLVFIDFTGKTCSICKQNEKRVFPLPEITKALLQYELVQLYTDTVDDNFYQASIRSGFGRSVARQNEDAMENHAFKDRAFGTQQLPLYVILDPRPDGKVSVVGVYPEASISDKAAFARFLQEPLERKGGLASR